MPWCLQHNFLVNQPNEGIFIFFIFSLKSDMATWLDLDQPPVLLVKRVKWKGILLGFTGFHRVLLGFTGFYWVILDFIGFYWVLLGYTGFHRVLLGFTGFHRVLLGYTGFYWVFIGMNGRSRVLTDMATWLDLDEPPILLVERVKWNRNFFLKKWR